MFNLVLCIAICAVIGYLLGSVNFAIIFTRLFKKMDIRDMGSGNAGFTNVLRSVGKIPALLTLIGDFSKGILAVVILRTALYYILGTISIPAEYLVALAALLGHLFPVFYQFKGGKGILVSFGALMILSPIAGLICLGGFLVTLIASKYVSLGSIVAAIMFPVAVFALSFPFNSPPWECLMALPISGLIIFMHRQNIVRLVNHTENKISVKR